MLQPRWQAIFLGGWLITVLSACSDGSDNRREPNPYAEDSLWLCKPGIADDRCLSLDQTLTVVFADGNTAVFEHEAATSPEFDCFYVYPTVDLREEPGNTLDLSDDSLMLRPLYNQAARFSQFCALFAPKYRQMTIGSYQLEDPLNSEFFLLGYGDIEQAFDQYLVENPNRDFVLMGHSQGSHVLLRLLQNRFDNNPALRERLISALTIGPTGALEVPAGAAVGGSFNTIPLCQFATDTGCIVAYDSLAAGGADDRPAPPTPRPCTDPTLLGDEPGILASAIYNRDELPFPEGVETDWIAYPSLYAAACEEDGFLAIDTAPGRTTVFTPQIIQAALGGSSLHVADYNLAMGDLLRIVARQAANH